MSAGKAGPFQLAFFTLPAETKIAFLLFLLREVIPQEQQTIVFVASKHHVELLQMLLGGLGFTVAFVYGALDHTARQINIERFRSGAAKILIVTDVAARGIDIPLLDNVINVDFPPKPKLFVHRVGRAGRAGRLGKAYSMVAPDEVCVLPGRSAATA